MIYAGKYTLRGFRHQMYKIRWRLGPFASRRRLGKSTELGIYYKTYMLIYPRVYADIRWGIRQYWDSLIPNIGGAALTYNTLSISPRKRDRRLREGVRANAGHTSGGGGEEETFRNAERPRKKPMPSQRRAHERRWRRKTSRSLLKRITPQAGARAEPTPSQSRYVCQLHDDVLYKLLPICVSMQTTCCKTDLRPTYTLSTPAARRRIFVSHKIVAIR